MEDAKGASSLFAQLERIEAQGPQRPSGGAQRNQKTGGKKAKGKEQETAGGDSVHGASQEFLPFRLIEVGFGGELDVDPRVGFTQRASGDVLPTVTLVSC